MAIALETPASEQAAGPGAAHRLIVETRETPNPQAYKFTFGGQLLAEGAAEFSQGQSTGVTSLDAVLELEEVERIYVSGDFLTVICTEDAEWVELAARVRHTVHQHAPESDWSRLEGNIELVENTTTITEWMTSRVLPATEKDGGGIFLQSVESDTLWVRLAGACQGCPYAPQTLQQGILKPVHQMVSEIRHVGEV